jgi:hypothetical protein
VFINKLLHGFINWYLSKDTKQISLLGSALFAIWHSTTTMEALFVLPRPLVLCFVFQ